MDIINIDLLKPCSTNFIYLTIIESNFIRGIAILKCKKHVTLFTQSVSVLYGIKNYSKLL